MQQMVVSKMTFDFKSDVNLFSGNNKKTVL